MDIQHDSWIKVSKNGSPLPQFLKRHYVVFTLFRNRAFKTEKKINILCKEQLPSGKLETVFRTTQTVSSCFRFKDVIPRPLLSGVIYKYKCPRCKSRYTGSTYRYWEKRLEEYLFMSALTSKPLKGLQSFAPMLQAKGKCYINSSSDDFRIIGKEKDRHWIWLKESIFSGTVV